MAQNKNKTVVIYLDVAINSITGNTRDNTYNFVW